MPEAVVLSCEHSVNRVPSRYADLFRDARRVLESHRGYDAGALLVARVLARELQAPLWTGAVSRLVVDLNRSAGHPFLFSEYVRGVTTGEKARIMSRYYFPYRSGVEAAIGDQIAAGRAVLHLSIHSFVPVLDGHVRRADLGLLYDPARARERDVCRSLKSHVARVEPELVVRRNYPYRGKADGLATHLRRIFDARDYAGVEIELNQKRVRTAPESGRLGRMLGQVIKAALSG